MVSVVLNIVMVVRLKVTSSRGSLGTVIVEARAGNGRIVDVVDVIILNVVDKLEETVKLLAAYVRGCSLLAGRR